MIERQTFIATSAMALRLLVAPFASEAQQAGKVPRVGLLTAGVSPDRIEAFREGLRQLG